MILIDMGHLSSRLLYTAVSMTKPKLDKETGKFNTDSFIDMYAHLLLSNLRYLKKNFEREYGEMVLCLDSRNNWRKEFYAGYKASRADKRKSSDIDFASFYEHDKDIIERIEAYFPFRVVKVDKAEADDIVGVLAKHYSLTQKTVVVSSDKDFKQVLDYPNVRLFEPMSKVFVNMTPDEVKEWKIEHILVGDTIDDIPHIKDKTELSEEFVKFMVERGVSKDIPLSELKVMNIFKSLIDEFEVYETNKKGEVLGKKVYKKIGFADKGAYKFAQALKENLKSNPLYIENFKRNQTLVLFDNIPVDIKEKIVDSYKEATVKFDVPGILATLSKYNLMELMKSSSDFYHGVQNNNIVGSSLGEWS